MAQWKAPKESADQQEHRRATAILLRRMSQLNTIAGYGPDHLDVDDMLLGVKAMLCERFGHDHELSRKWEGLKFRSLGRSEGEGTLASREAEEEFLKEIAQARTVISAAVDAWSVTPIKGQSTASPVFHNTLTNSPTTNAVAGASSTSCATADFDLKLFVRLVEDDTTLTDEQRSEAKEHLGDLGRELLRQKPRWEKIKESLKPMLDLSKEVAIKVMAAVAAELVKKSMTPEG